MAAPRPTRRALFVAGKLTPKREGSKPCANGWHDGPLVDTARFEAAGGIWHGTGMCSACGAHVHRSQLRRSS